MCINVAIEGQMLMGAMSGALFGTVAHNLGVGVIAAMLSGGLLGLLLAVFSIRYLVNQVVLGVVLNLLALGLTGYIFDALMAPNQNGLNNPGFYSPIKIPVLGDIPIVGPLLFDTTLIVYFAYVLIIVLDVALFRTRWGLRTRAVGEHPKAADTVGHQRLPHPLPQRRLRRPGRRAGRRRAHHRLDRAVPEERLQRAGLHRAGRADLRSLEPAGRDRRGAVLRLRRGAAEPALHPADAGHHPDVLPGHDAVPRDGRRGGRPGRQGARAGGRRRALRQGLTDRWTIGVTIDWEALRDKAIEAMRAAYAPYSNFPVGVAGLVDDGRIVSGCNVENASYGVTLCAECGLVSDLVRTGGGRLVAVACVDAHGQPLQPCGRCRQLLWEHGGAECLVDGPDRPLTMAELLPWAFGPDNLDD